jgi:hypothetical protein
MSRPCTRCDEHVTLIEDNLCRLCLEFTDAEIMRDLLSPTGEFDAPEDHHTER